ncbi:MAG: GNAT family N-acetyltransferase [Bacillaceae bacterium]|nr:GNAT family N-acetyltransferase [Bacillaceae bacterium]
MLKKRDLHEVHLLFELLTHPEVYPFVRDKADNFEEYLFITKQLIEEEDRGKLISRTILNEKLQPIGTITLYNIQNNTGFLATWIGKPYFGRGYNQKAKETFLFELFTELGIESVFMKIKKSNSRSKRAAEKLPYSEPGKFLYPEIYNQINMEQELYDLYVIQKHRYLNIMYQDIAFEEVNQEA